MSITDSCVHDSENEKYFDWLTHYQFLKDNLFFIEGLIVQPYEEDGEDDKEVFSAFPF